MAQVKVGVAGMPDRQSTSVARCPTKVRRTRPDALDTATTLGYPVVPYKCPNGHDHWHVGTNRQETKLFYTDRPAWERKARNQDMHQHECLRCHHKWESMYEYPSRCHGCDSSAFDIPIGGYVGRRGNITDKGNA